MVQLSDSPCVRVLCGTSSQAAADRSWRLALIRCMCALTAALESIDISPLPHLNTRTKQKSSLCFGARWNFACGAPRDKNRCFINSTVMSLSKNHDPLTQDKTHTMSAAVFWRDYFLSVSLRKRELQLLKC